MVQRLMYWSQHGTDFALGLTDGTGGEVGAVLVSEQALYLADAQMVLSRQYGNMAQQPRFHLA